MVLTFMAKTNKSTKIKETVLKRSKLFGCLGCLAKMSVFQKLAIDR